MVTIKTSEVKKFIAAAKPIKDTRILPIYGYVQLVCEGDSATFYKSNGQAFVVCSVKVDFKKNETFIIEEKTLFGFVMFSSGSDIKIDRTGDKINISDKVKSISCQSVDDVYPEIQKKESGDQFLLDADVLASLFLAKSHALVGDKTMKSWMSFVHITKVGKTNYVVGCNGGTSYLKSFKAKLPIISIEPEDIPIISRLPQVYYSQAGNYDYYDGGKVAYGFAKTENKCADLTQYVNNLKTDKQIIVSRKSIVDFCDMILNVNNSNIPPEITIESVDKKNIGLNFADVSGNQTAEEKVSVDEMGITLPKLIFQPKNILLTLKDLGVDKIKIGYAYHNLIITSDEDKNYFGSVMELAKV